MVSSGGIGLSLSGCGFLASYHMGSALCLHRHSPTIVSKMARFAGCSGGSLVAAILALCPDKLQESLGILYKIADEVNELRFGALNSGFCLSARLEEALQSVLPRDVSVLSGNRLFISVTNQRDGSNRLLCNFPTKDHLIRALLASCYIPIYSQGPGPCGSPPLIDEIAYIDGSLSNILPKFSDLKTITVSPFSGEAEISPRDMSAFSGTVFDWKFKFSNQGFKVNLKNIVRGRQALFPPNSSRLKDYCDMGFRDTMKYLLENGCLERHEGTSV